MKTVAIIYEASWSTDLEVPDDFQPTQENIQALIGANEDRFDFQDGGANWHPSALECDGEFFEIY